MSVLDYALLRAKAPGHHDLAVLGERFTDGLERLLDCGIDEAAGVYDDEIGARVGRGRGIAFGAQLREDALRIDERLGTA